MVAYDLLRWIPLIPLLASVINLFWGRALDKKFAGTLACAAVGASLALAFHVFVMAYEEPTLADTFGETYAAYRRTVKRWVPTLPRND